MTPPGGAEGARNAQRAKGAEQRAAVLHAQLAASQRAAAETRAATARAEEQGRAAAAREAARRGPEAAAVAEVPAAKTAAASAVAPPDSFSPLRPGAAAAAACGDVARTLRHCRRRATLFRRLCRPRRKRAGTRADGRGAREGALYWAFPNIGKTHSMVGLSLTFLYFFFLRVCPSRMRLACVWRGRLVRPALPARDSRVVLLILAGLDGPQPRRQHGVTEASHALRSHGRAPTPALCSPLHQFR